MLSFESREPIVYALSDFQDIMVTFTTFNKTYQEKKYSRIRIGIFFSSHQGFSPIKPLMNMSSAKNQDNFGGQRGRTTS
jgi:hypothetical protein